ncbi:transaldolase [Candidatus Gottesmanbacteria bacterium]|nr:transaldolase [Candidatus Gottesmanbacteria bacterium]
MELPSKIFIDGGDPAETHEADELLKKAGFLTGVTGQTTNPSLIAKRFARESGIMNQESGKPKVSSENLIDYYKKTVQEISRIIPEGAISIQVIGDPATLTTEDMLTQARDRMSWIPNGVVKFPATTAGLAAAEVFCQEGPVNITLTFSQEQAAAVYVATKAHNYDVYVSPFVGRMDDRGENGMDVVANITSMYRYIEVMKRPKVLTASVRTVAHILYALWLKSDVITIPFKLLKQWENEGFPIPPKDFIYDAPGLAEIPYHELSLDVDWHEFDLTHDLTDIGLKKFWEDWKVIIQ